MAKLTPKELDDYREIVSNIAPQLRDFRKSQLRQLFENIPYSWRLLDEFTPHEPLKKRVTFYIDEDMLKFFQQNDVQWQARIREILRAFMVLQLKKHLKREMPTPQELVDQWLEVKPEKLTKQQKKRRAQEQLQDQVEEGAIAAMLEVALAMERFAEFHDVILKMKAQHMRERLDSEKGVLIKKRKGSPGLYRWRERSPYARLCLRVVLERMNRMRVAAELPLMHIPEELRKETDKAYKAEYPHEYQLYKELVEKSS